MATTAVATAATPSPVETTSTLANMRRGAKRLGDFWLSLQVELHGQYSFRRLHALHDYCQKTSLLHVVLICVSTPLPCLVLVTLMDLIPMTKPSDGIYKNYVFWIRNWLAVAFITLAVLEQFRSCLPRLPMSNKAMGGITVLATTMGVGWQFICSHFIGFPLPFGLVIGTMTWTPGVLAGCYWLWGNKIKQDRSLFEDVMHYLIVFSCQISLTLIYPLYIYVFNSLSSNGQTAFVLMLPVIKISAKNWISCFLKDMDDLKPEVVIFNIEIFNALYVSCSMQNASSNVTTIVIMVTDLLQAWLAVYDINQLLGKLQKLVDKMPRGVDSPASPTFIDICVELLKDPRVRDHPRLQGKKYQSILFKKKDTPKVVEASSVLELDAIIPATLGVTLTPLGTQAESHLAATIQPETTSEMKMQEIRVSESIQSGEPTLADATVDALGVVQEDPLTGRPQEDHPVGVDGGIPQPTSLSPLQSLTLDERVDFVKDTTQVLFVTEFVLLIEFTEVVMPIIYSMYMLAMSHLPNRQYYPQLAKLSDERLAEIIANVLTYSALEFLSFAAIAVLLKWKLKISSLHQLSFVLDTQMANVQSKLILWTFYVVQSMLFHFDKCSHVPLPTAVGLVIGTCMWTPAVVVGCYTLWNKHFKQDRSLYDDLMQYLVVFIGQISITFTYPAYIFVFYSLDPVPQTVFVLVLPIIKIITKNWISRFLKDVDDLKPEVVIFNVEVFNALYVSCSLQNTTAWATTILFMLLDVVLAWLSLQDINFLLVDLDALLTKLPQNGQDRTILGICVELLQDPQVNNHARLRLRSHRVTSKRASLYVPRKPSVVVDASAAAAIDSAVQSTIMAQNRGGAIQVKSSISAGSTGAGGAGVTPVQEQASSLDASSNPLSVWTVEERVHFVENTLKMLFLVEFIVLIEFTEVIMPIIYTMYMGAMSRLPNRRHYPRLAFLSDQELVETIANVLTYSVLELISFVVITWIINRKLKFSTAHQVAFVMERQVNEVQSKLILWTFYIVQSMLFHFGVDFSMKFAWLKNNW